MLGAREQGMAKKGLACLVACLSALSVAAAPAEGPPVHWSFVRPTRPEVPVVREPSTIRNPIDSFVVSRLRAQGLDPAPEASRETLARRLSFDLIGFPPSPEERQAFLDDTSADAYEKYVDRLLASPHFGEKQAQAWLDLARYADTDGYEFDQERPEMWRYRDWVVSALNRDIPFDRFLTLQIAGDEVVPDDPEAIVATGFHRLYPDMVDLNDQAMRRQNALNDITETTASVFLGLTMGCARCHDHKFDPIKQREFYELQAFFTPAQFRDDLLIAAAPQRIEHEALVKTWKDEVRRVRTLILSLEAPFREKLAKGRPSALSDEAVKAFDKTETARDFEETRLVFEAIENDKRVSSGRLDQELDEPGQKTRARLRQELAALLKAPPPPLPRARGLMESGRESASTFLLRRGEFASKGPEVFPAFPEVLASVAAPEIVAQAHSSGRRTALAHWLTRPDHPLTARVLVNRLWQGHFGQGLVATPSDFGVMGDEPSHPELLDWLAVELVSQGWSVKAIHRLIVSSATYRQGSRAGENSIKIDPENRLLSRHARNRLDGETIRDAMLASSGLLNSAVGGPCVFPDLPRELTKLSGKGAIWPVSTREEDRNRRSLYVFLRRNLRFSLFEAFDKPDTNASCARRPSTTIAPQALSLLNGKLSSDCARALATRVSRLIGNEPSAQVETAYKLTLGRMPEPDERAMAIEFLNDAPLSDLCLALFNVNEFLYLD